ncbi:MAG: GNAT family N-acetyltransferase [Cyanobacteria bacterium SZAS-4]|nr:GNAT family N-acetyltransferase [Cyanobacteria bacterium SZAS-4]
MENFVNLQTDRLLLRRWKDSDSPPFSAMNADPVVMRHFPKMLTSDESQALIEKIEKFFEKESFGLWAVELASNQNFIGFVGLWRPTFDAHFTPCVEIGWRLAKEFWGQGYAPEAAKKVLEDGFERIGLDEIVAMTALPNKNSMRVMEKIGMTYDPLDNFMHPSLVDGHHLKEHVLYRIQKSDWIECK